MRKNIEKGFKMQVVIPMTGYGSRFKAAGYKDLKPFISVNGRPMIEWVVSMYPSDTYFYFIVRATTLENSNYKQVLKNIPNSEICVIPDNEWQKLGPVVDVLQFISSYKKDEPVFINYCDFFCLWDARKFEIEAIEKNVDGAIPCYTGFHPHLIPIKNVYASCKVDKRGNLEEIKEKYSFSEDKTQAHHSPGIYWFKDVSTMRKYCSKLVRSGNSLNGEFYASLVYNKMVKERKKVWVPDNVPYFCQWGTPEDLKEFEMWMSILNGGKK
jgi:NDP-sugar pyrophosphorylase family protein